MKAEHIFHVSRSEIMKTFVYHQTNFEHNAKFDRSEVEYKIFQA